MCSNPLFIYNMFGEKPLYFHWSVFKNNKTYQYGKEIHIEDCVQAPCRKCDGCRIQRAASWAVRCSLEARDYSDVSFITLTYDDAHLPKLGKLDKAHLSLFIRRLRYALKPLKFRFFAVGEYGERTKRPHYHIIIFGWCPSDLQKISQRRKDTFSPFLTNVWSAGFNTVSRVVNAGASAAYCGLYSSVCGEFNLMSRNPYGIGARWIDDSILCDEELYHNGIKQHIAYFNYRAKRVSPARYHSKKLISTYVFKRKFHTDLVLKGSIAAVLDSVRGKNYQKIFKKTIDRNL